MKRLSVIAAFTMVALINTNAMAAGKKNEIKDLTSLTHPSIDSAAQSADSKDYYEYTIKAASASAYYSEYADQSSATVEVHFNGADALLIDAECAVGEKRKFSSMHPIYGYYGALYICNRINVGRDEKEMTERNVPLEVLPRGPGDYIEITILKPWRYNNLTVRYREVRKIK